MQYTKAAYCDNKAYSIVIKRSLLILCPDAVEPLTKAVDGGFRGDDLHLVAKGEQPSVELR